MASLQFTLSILLLPPLFVFIILSGLQPLPHLAFDHTSRVLALSHDHLNLVAGPRVANPRLPLDSLARAFTLFDVFAAVVAARAAAGGLAAAARHLARRPCVPLGPANCN